MKSPSVQQSKNEVKNGDLVGGNKQETRIIFNYPPSTSASPYLKRLQERYVEIQKEDVDYRDFTVDELDYYTSIVENETIIGLEQKLSIGNRRNMIRDALRLKEFYHKKLLKSQFSETGQQINAFLLGLVRTYYLSYVFPHVCNNEEDSVIAMLINQNIVNPVMAELGENRLGFTSDQVLGMLYFLTGNCHLNWTNDVDIPPSI